MDTILEVTSVVLATNSVDTALADRVPEAVGVGISSYSVNELGTSPINITPIISTMSGELTGTALNEVSASTHLSNGQ